jgi:hypothetical protein
MGKEGNDGKAGKMKPHDLRDGMGGRVTPEGPVSETVFDPLLSENEGPDVVGPNSKPVPGQTTRE